MPPLCQAKGTGDRSTTRCRLPIPHPPTPPAGLRVHLAGVVLQGGLGVGVPELLLHVVHGRAGLQQLGCQRPPQVMRLDVAHLGRHRRLNDHLPHGRGGHRGSLEGKAADRSNPPPSSAAAAPPYKLGLLKDSCVNQARRDCVRN